GLAVISGAGTFGNGQSTTILAPSVVTNGPTRYTFKRFNLNGAFFGTDASFTKTFATTDATNLNFVAEYDGKNILPLIIGVGASSNNPVSATTNFVVTIQFDRSMNSSIEPVLLFTNNAAAVQPIVPTGGLWIT